MKFESQPRWLFSTSQALATLILLVFFFTLLNGYLLNLTTGYQANAWLVLAGLVLELLAVLAGMRALVSVRFDGLELAGFCAVVFGVWWYLLAPALPTLLPPTQSIDAVRHYTQALFSYPRGTLVSWYPAGGAFLVATFSHWLGASPLRVLHPMAATFVALTAGAVYGITCGLLPDKPISKLAALAAPLLLFVPWTYFAGIVNWEQYFYAQVVAQYFVMSAALYIVAFAGDSDWRWLALVAAALLGTVAAYPYLAALPAATLILVTFSKFARGTLTARQRRAALLSLVIFAGLLVIAAAALLRGGILDLESFRIATRGDVGQGGVTNPSLENLGGPLFLLLALVGILFAWRAGGSGRAILWFLCAWLLQLALLLVTQPFLQISGYRIDKTFYILIFPLSILGALLPGRALERRAARWQISRLVQAVACAVIVIASIIAIQGLRPAKPYSPLSESELQVALWAKEHLDTYQVSYLDPQPVRAYWLAFGLWAETLPNEWFQWIPAGPKLGPSTLAEWLRDPAWPQWILTRDMQALAGMAESDPSLRVAYRSGDSAILQKQVAAAAAPRPLEASAWQFGSTLRLVGYDLNRTSFLPGESINLTTYAESMQPPPASVAWRMELVDSSGSVVSKATGDPFQGKYPLQRWPPGRYAQDVWNLPITSEVPAGVYALQLGLYRRTDGEAVEVRSTPAAAEQLSSAPLAKIKISIAPPSPDELRAATPLHRRVGDPFELSDYALSVDRAARTIHLTLYWQSLVKTMTDYTVFVHLVDPSGQMAAQKDAPPLDGRYPTSVWDPGETVKEDYGFVIPAAVTWPSSIEIGMYALPDLKRLPVGTGDRIVLPLDLR